MTHSRLSHCWFVSVACALLASGCQQQTLPAPKTRAANIGAADSEPAASSHRVEPATAFNAGARQCILGDVEPVRVLPESVEPLRLPRGQSAVPVAVEFGTRGGLLAWGEPAGLHAPMLSPEGRPTGTGFVLNEMPHLAPVAVVPAAAGFFVLSRRRSFYFDKCKRGTFNIGRAEPRAP